MPENMQQSQPQPIDALMTKLGLSNADLVSASTEQLTFKNVQKARTGRRLTPNIQEKILKALQKLKPELKLARRDLFRYDVEEVVVKAIHEANKLGAARKINYPQMVDRLLKAGLTRYEVEVATHRITYFAPAGEAHTEQGPAEDMGLVGLFRPAAIQAAIAEAQKGLIDYLTFLKRILAAGVVRYESNLRSREIRYMGEALTYKERIPAATPEGSAEPPPAPKAPKPAVSKAKVKKKAFRKKVNNSLKARKKAKKSWKRQ